MEVSTDQTFVLRFDPYAEEPSKKRVDWLRLGRLAAREPERSRTEVGPVTFPQTTPGQMIGRIFGGSISCVARTAGSRQLMVIRARLSASADVRPAALCDFS
jgi:hypothetical protein